MQAEVLLYGRPPSCGWPCLLLFLAYVGCLGWVSRTLVSSCPPSCWRGSLECLSLLVFSCPRSCGWPWPGVPGILVSLEWRIPGLLVSTCLCVPLHMGGLGPGSWNAWLSSSPPAIFMWMAFSPCFPDKGPWNACLRLSPLVPLHVRYPLEGGQWETQAETSVPGIGQLSPPTYMKGDK